MFTKSTIFAGLVSIAAAAPVTSSSQSSQLCQASQYDTAAKFQSDCFLNSTVWTKSPPSGYSLIYGNLNASNQAPFGYLTYSQMAIYDPAACAKRCNAVAGCSSFDIYFERDPAIDPTPDCPNPASAYFPLGLLGAMDVKCALYSSILSQDYATNFGQYRQQFQVAIAGSNAYVLSSLLPGGGYTAAPGTVGGQVQNGAAINAPLDANGNNTYAGNQWWNDGQLNVARCAQACSAHTAYTQQHGGLPCNFINTYLQTQPGQTLEQQQCSFYSQAWTQDYATNYGNADGSVVVSQSYIFVAPQ